MTCQPWRLPPLPAKRATSRMSCTIASGTGSSVKSRIDGVERITSRSSMEGASRGPGGAMAATVPVIRFLDRDQSLELLTQACVGRVAVVVNGVPEITPVNYALLDG